MASDKGKAKEPKGQEDARAQASQDEAKAGEESNCCEKCLKIIYVVLCVVVVSKSILEIVVTVSNAIFNKLTGTEDSGRLVGMIILTLMAAVTISILVNAVVAVFRNLSRPLFAATIVLLIVASVQALLAGVAVRVTSQDELHFIKSLENSFQLAKEKNQKHEAIWSAMQKEFNCCGIHSPEDYRPSKFPDFLAPDVPISCCPSYDPKRSDMVQEKERQICKSRKTYYALGCQEPAVDWFKSTADLVQGITVSLITFEVILAIMSAILVRNIKRLKKAQQAEPEKGLSTN